MTAKALMRFIVGILLGLLLGCGYFYPTNVKLEYGREWEIPGKRDFRLDAGYYALPKREDPQEIEMSLRAILKQEIMRAQICPYGYEVTGTGGYEGGGYHYIEGLCKEVITDENIDQE